MQFVSAMKAWGARRSDDDTIVAMRAGGRAVEATRHVSIVMTCLTAAMASAVIGPLAFVWLAPTVAWLIVLPTAEPAIKRALRVEEETQAAEAFHAIWGFLYHGLWASLGVLIWFLGGVEYKVLGFLTCMGLALHVVVSHRDCWRIARWCLAAPALAILIIGVHGWSVEGEWAWLVGVLAMLGAIGSAAHSFAKLTADLRAAQRESEARLARWELAGKVSRAALWHYDFATGAHDWSDAMGEITGHDPLTMVQAGKDFASVAPEPWRSKVNESYRSARDSHATSWSMEYPILRPDGVEIWIENRLSFLREDRKLTHVVGMIQDVTESQARVREAEAASDAKSTFLANISHEIRTPMNAILGSARLMAREPLPQVASDYVETIKVAGLHLMALLNDLLDISKIEAGRLSLAPMPTSLHALLRQQETLWRARR